MNPLPKPHRLTRDQLGPDGAYLSLNGLATFAGDLEIEPGIERLLINGDLVVHGSLRAERPVAIDVEGEVHIHGSLRLSNGSLVATGHLWVGENAVASRLGGGTGVDCGGRLLLQSAHLPAAGELHSGHGLAAATVSGVTHILGDLVIAPDVEQVTFRGGCVLLGRLEAGRDVMLLADGDFDAEHAVILPGGSISCSANLRVHGDIVASFVAADSGIDCGGCLFATGPEGVVSRCGFVLVRRDLLSAGAIRAEGLVFAGGEIAAAQDIQSDAHFIQGGGRILSGGAIWAVSGIRAGGDIRARCSIEARCGPLFSPRVIAAGTLVHCRHLDGGVVEHGSFQGTRAPGTLEAVHPGSAAEWARVLAGIEQTLQMVADYPGALDFEI